MRHYFITTILLSLSTICLAQQHTIVFDQEGRIVKNYGFEKSDKYDLEYTFLIEGVTTATQENYFLIYQWRNDYLYEANNTFQNNTVSQIGNFDSQGYLKISYPKKKDEKKFVKKTDKNTRLLSYQLIKVNDCGKDILADTEEMTLNSLEDQCIEKSLEIDSTSFTFTNLDSLAKKNDRLKIAEDNLRKLERQKKDETFSSDFSDLLKDKSLLEKKLEIRNQQLEKLGGGKDECCTTDNLEGVTNRIIELTDTLHVKEGKIDSLQKVHENKLRKANSNVRELKKSVEKIITESLKIDISPIYTLLHQGALVSKDKNRFEIVYDVKRQKLYDSNKDLLNIARVTPNLPQLTTESDLYLHILNLRPSDLKGNPFAISLSSSLSAEVPIESPANFQGLQNVDVGLDLTSLAGLNLDSLNLISNLLYDPTEKNNEFLETLMEV